MVDICYICAQTQPLGDQNTSDDDCAACRRPVCKKHGRDVRGGEKLFCLRCLDQS